MFLKKPISKVFPSGLKVRIWHSRWCDLGSFPIWGSEILQAVWHGKKKKKEKKKKTKKQPASKNTHFILWLVNKWIFLR